MNREDYDQKDVEFCVELALRLHAGQTDKGGHPYSIHIHRVVSGVTMPFQKCVAALHDSIEDKKITADTIENLVGEEVSKAVFKLTRFPSEIESYESYINQILQTQDDDIIAVKLADLRHNMDVTRLNEITDKDIDILRKYHNAYLTLTGRK